MRERIDNTIHIRPNVGSVEEAQYRVIQYQHLYSHIVMLSAHNFLIIMHHPDHECFICRQTGMTGVKEKYIY